MERFLERARERFERVFGESVIKDGVVRTMASHLGQFDGNALVEMNWVDFSEDAGEPHPVLQFYSTLAQNIEEEELPAIKSDLSDLNGVTMLGYFGCYEPLNHLYHCYRMPVNLEAEDAMLDEVEYVLRQIERQLDLLLDYVLYVAEEPGKMSVAEYLTGIGLTGE